MNAAWLRGARLVLGRQPAENDSDRRFLAVARGAATAVGARCAALVASFVAVPLTVSYLGAERYGAWVTIGTTITWFSIADLGLGNGLTAALSEAYGLQRTDLAQQNVATAFWLLASIAAGCGLIFAAASGFIDWAQLLNVRSPLAVSEVSRAATLAVALFIVSFPLGIVDRVYAAYHEGAAANFWAAAASAVTLVAVVFATRTSGGMVLLVLALSGSRVVVQLASAIWLFVRHHPELRPALGALRWERVRRFSHASWRFFVIQAAGLVLFSTDNFIIARTLGSERVTPYSVAWSLFSLPTLGITLAFPYLWPAYTHALARKDHRWIRRAFRASLAVSLGIAFLASMPLTFFGRSIIRLWAGEVAVPPFALLVWMAIWSLVNTGLNAVVCLLNAAEEITLQAIAGVVTAILNLVLSVVWARSYGITGVIAATVVSFVVGAVLPMAFDVGRLFGRLRPDHFSSET